MAKENFVRTKPHVNIGTIGQSCLTVVNVTDSTDVYVRYGAHKSLFCHCFVCLLIIILNTYVFAPPQILREL